MPKQTFIIAIIVLVVILGVLSYLLINTLGPSTPGIFRESGNRDPFILGEQIVYVCDDEDGTDQICVINTDGSSWRVITAQQPTRRTGDPDRRPYVAYSNPSINEEGHAIWACSDSTAFSSRSYLCHKNIQTARAAPPSELWEHENTYAPMIGPEGDILYGCEKDLCGGRMGNASSSFVGRGATYYPVYDLGYHQDAVFGCVIWIGDTQTRFSVSDICYAEFYGSGEFEKLTHAVHDGSIQYTEPSIDSFQHIAFQCSERINEDETRYDICVINHDGTEFMNITQDTPMAGISSDPVLSEHGLVVFQCAVNQAEHLHKLCVSDIEGLEYRLLHEMPAQLYLGRVSVYDDLIVYECNNEICIINADGTGHSQLTPVAGANP